MAKKKKKEKSKVASKEVKKIKPKEIITPDEQSLSGGFLLWKVSNDWQRELTKLLKPHDITHVQFLILEAIQRLNSANERTTQAKIAEAIQSDVMMVSKVVRALEAKEMLKRTPNSVDKRIFEVEITQKGKLKLTKTSKVIAEFDAHFFKAVDTKKASLEKRLKQLIAQ